MLIQITHITHLTQNKSDVIQHGHRFRLLCNYLTLTLFFLSFGSPYYRAVVKPGEKSLQMLKQVNNQQVLIKFSAEAINMCVDDYQFRHHTAKREKICKRFLFKNEQGQERVFLVNISQFERSGELCLCEILLHLQRKGLEIKDYGFYIPQLNITVEAGDRCRIPFDTITSKELLFQMKTLDKIEQEEDYQMLYVTVAGQDGPDEFNWQNTQKPSIEDESSDPLAVVHESQKQQVSNSTHEEEEKFREQERPNEKQIQNLTQQHQMVNETAEGSNENRAVKKPKEAEKTIYQAIYLTKMWRKIHEQYNFSLKCAARIVNLSKKTLDDYFLVLRVAEFHRYNFKTHLNQKIGHLRAYIRKQPVKVNCFALVPEPDLSQIPLLNDWSRVDQIEQIVKAVQTRNRVHAENCCTIQ